MIGFRSFNSMQRIYAMVALVVLSFMVAMLLIVYAHFSVMSSFQQLKSWIFFYTLGILGIALLFVFFAILGIRKVLTRISKVIQDFILAFIEDETLYNDHFLPEVEPLFHKIQKQLEEKHAIQNELIQELTIRLSLEQELARLNQEKAEILESMTEAFYLLDINWCFTYLNKEAERLLQRCRKELLGKCIWTEYPAAVGGVFDLQFHYSVNENQPVVFEAPFTVETLEYLCEFRAYPSQYGLTVYFRDITLKNKAEEKIRASEDRFYKAFHYSPYMLAIVREQNWTYLDGNERFLKGWDMKQEEVIGKSMYQIGMRPEQVDEICRILRETGELLNQEFMVIEDKLVLQISAVPITINSERCYLFIHNDVSEIKKIQKEVSRLDRLNLVGQMAAGIGHEIRNPMTTVRGYIQLLGMNPEFVDRKETFDIMLAELDRANSIITEFLSLARTKPTALKTENLNTILAKLYPLIEADAFTHNMQICFYRVKFHHYT